MLIGFDFDNTIVSYDALFYQVASEKKLLTPEIPINKIAIRDHFRKTNREDIWTEMQGYVYGARMMEASAFPNVVESLVQLQAQGHQLVIISHKTKYPYLGESYDLHAAALQWIKTYLGVEGRPLFGENNIYFATKKEDKIAKIAQLGCDFFIDDLPEILLAHDFPPTTKRFLFDPEHQFHDLPLENIQRVTSWLNFLNYLS